MPERAVAQDAVESGAYAASGRVRIGYLLVSLLAAFALFASLDDRMLWGDEAETALLAENVTRFGVPRSEDGRNRISHLGVADSNAEGIWTWSPWLDEYVAAASFALGGPSAHSARLPFAAAGLATVLLLGWLSQRTYHDHELSLTAMALLTTCVPFLLHSRQCRYYALAMLAMLWLVIGFQQLTRGQGRGSAHLAGALSVLFYSNYVIVPGVLLGLLSAGAMLGRTHHSLIRGLLLGLGAFALLIAPWLWYAGIGSQAASLSTARFLPNLAYYTSELHFHAIPWVVLAIPLFARALRGRREARERPIPAAARPGRAIEILVIWIVVWQLLVLSLAPFRFFRYLAPLLPLLMLLAAGILRRELRPAWLRRGVVLTLCLTNVISVASAFPLADKHPTAAPLATFLLSLTRDYIDRSEDVVIFLRGEASPDESISSPDPEFPLIFHTGMRVRDARAARAWPPRPPLPDWILTTSASGVATRDPLELPPEVLQSYREVLLEVHRSRRGGGRPDPHFYEYFTSEGREAMPVYRLRR